MKTARDLLDPHPLVVGPDLPVAELARQLLAAHADGACVLRDGRLVGVVTSMDLVFREKRVHLPTFVALMDLVIPLGVREAEAELHKVAGGRVAEIMSAAPVTVGPDARLDEIAALMVEQHLTLVPVVEGDALRGVVTKPSLLRATLAPPPAP